MGKCYTFQDTHFRWYMWIVILYIINFSWNYFCQMLAYLPVCYVDGRWYSQLSWCWLWQMLLSPIVCEPLDVIGRCYLPCGCDMADDFCHCGRWNSHIFVVTDGKPHFEIIDDVVTVADGKATMWMADVIAIVVNGITTLITGWCYNQCSRWNSHMYDSWCYC